MSDDLERCYCYRCSDERDKASDPPREWHMRETMRFIVCATCGNKRCPHATDHRLTCTGSNEPGQAGSNYA